MQLETIIKSPKSSIFINLQLSHVTLLASIIKASLNLVALMVCERREMSTPSIEWLKFTNMYTQTTKFRKLGVCLQYIIPTFHMGGWGLIPRRVETLGSVSVNHSLTTPRCNNGTSECRGGQV